MNEFYNVGVLKQHIIFYPDVLFWPILEQRGNMASVMNSDEQPPGK